MAKQSVESDFSIFKSLWSRINDAVVRPPTPGNPARDILLMEMPGYPINPDIFDVEKFRKNSAAMSPACATAMFVDRVPALAPYFYDTGSRISFYWEQLLKTSVMVDDCEDNPALKGKYDTAIEMLYGGQDEYKNNKKTELFNSLDMLRTEWQEAEDELEMFRMNCQTKINWPDNYETHVKPYVDKIVDAFTEYDNVRSQIKQYQAAIFQYTRGDLSVLLMQQRQVMGRRTLYDAGRSGVFFNQTFLEPADWWKWFKDDKDDEPADDEGWTSIEVNQDDLYASENDTMKQFAADSHIDFNFSGLFSFVESNNAKTQKAFTSESTNLKFSFKIRKVAIDCPWIDMDIIQYSNIGIRGLKACSWSIGELHIKKNKGIFPLLPTHFVVAKDIEISAQLGDMKLSAILKSADEAIASSQRIAVGIGCFTVKGNFSSNEYSQHFPKFPTVSMDHQNQSMLEKGSEPELQQSTTTHPPYPKTQLPQQPDKLRGTIKNLKKLGTKLHVIPKKH